MRGSRATFLAFCRCGSVLIRTCSPSVSIQVSSACGCPSGIRVTTVARFLPLASRTTSSSSGIRSLLAARAAKSTRADASPRPPPHRTGPALLWPRKARAGPGFPRISGLLRRVTHGRIHVRSIVDPTEVIPAAGAADHGPRDPRGRARTEMSVAARSVSTDPPGDRRDHDEERPGQCGKYPQAPYPGRESPMAGNTKPSPERAGDRDKALESALLQIERQFGKGSVMRL